MINFNSDYSANELIDRWDEFTSPARFAGSDDTMDLIFVSKRKNDRVRLVRRSRNALEPFACVFRGKIVDKKITGVFTKAIIDYIVVAAIYAFLLYMRSYMIENGNPLKTINALLVIATVFSVALLLNTRRTKRKYCEFIARIVGKDNDYFLRKNEEEA